MQYWKFQIEMVITYRAQDFVIKHVHQSTHNHPELCFILLKKRETPYVRPRLKKRTTWIASFFVMKFSFCFFHLSLIGEFKIIVNSTLCKFQLASVSKKVLILIEFFKSFPEWITRVLKHLKTLLIITKVEFVICLLFQDPWQITWLVC